MGLEAFFPITFPLIIDFYYKQRQTRWLPTDISFATDMRDMKKLREEDSIVADAVEVILEFFSTADALVADNITSNFLKWVAVIKEAIATYTEIASVEMIHNETYGLSIQAAISDETRQKEIFSGERPTVKAIQQFAIDHMSEDKPLLARILAFVCIEGIMFTNTFAFIYWISRKNILKGFCKANEWIARDEALHTRFGIAMYAFHEERGEKLTETQAKKVVTEAVGISEKFIYDMLKEDRIGMTRENLIDYTKCTADKVMESIGFEPIYKVKNPFEWMALISLPNKTNFFEAKVSEYAAEKDDGTGKNVTKEVLTFDADDEDF